MGAMISLRPRTLGVGLLLALPGCFIDDIDLSNRSCPCIEGWVCDESVDRCVLADGGGVATDAPMDAPIDSGPPPPTCDSIGESIFCEDFEAADLARWSSIAPSEGGMIPSSTGAARAGMQDLRITTAGGTSPARMTAMIDTGTATTLYFGAWVYVASASVGPIDLFVDKDQQHQ